MQDQNIVPQVSPNSAALNAEHYQSFEMAKANDDILANGTLKELINYQAQVRAMLEYTHKLVSTMSSWDEFTSSRAETLATEQAAANLNVFIDQRMGELVAALPKATGNQYQQGASLPAGNKAKGEALQDAGLTPKTASQLEQLAKNPEVVEAVIAKAEKDGRVVSRAQVLKAIKERDAAREKLDSTQREVKASHALGERMKAELDGTKEDLAEAIQAQEDAEAEVTMLRRKLDSIEHPEPEVIERKVVREVESSESKRRIAELEHLERIHCKDNQTLRRHLEETRKELDRAKGILGMDSSTRNVQRDVEYLITATNQYVRNYGGLTWTFERIAEVDEITRNDLRKAVKNLATFSSALMAGLEQMQ